MSQILFEGKFYDKISSASLYESDYENLVFEHSEYLYPNFFMLPFKAIVCSEEGSAKPDFVLIEKNYQNWWIGEIELSHHSLEGHIIPQVNILANAVYDEKIVTSLAEANSVLDQTRLSAMAKGSQPRVIVVIDSPQPNWAGSLDRYSAILEVIEVFRSIENKYVLRLNGQHPPRNIDQYSECGLEPLLSRLLRIDAPALLPMGPHEKIFIKFEDGVSEWERIDIQDAVFLSPCKFNPLKPKEKYILKLLENGSLEISTKYPRRN